MNLTEILKKTVDEHSILQNNWLQLKSITLNLADLKNWLGQEYFVSVAFVKWFLWTAALTDDINAKIVLVQNIWEELGEGNASESHVKILDKFLGELGVNVNEIKIYSGTATYLEEMKAITHADFYEALGALGPANEYLLKREYSLMYESYQKLKITHQLPDGRFFSVNLEADESHSVKMFQLIEKVCDSHEKKEKVIKGTNQALNARTLFYKDLPV